MKIPRRYSSVRFRLVAGGAIAALVVGALNLPSADAAGRTSLFSGEDVRRVNAYTGSPVEVGLRFKVAKSGDVSAIKFLKAEGSEGSHPVSLWSSDGSLLTTAVSSGESASGWQRVEIPPVRLLRGHTYVASYHTAIYSGTNNFFRQPVRKGPLSAPAGRNGVYAYGTGSSFPRDSYRSTNYWVDVEFTATTSTSGQPGPSTSSTVAPTTSSTSSTVAPSSTTTSTSVPPATSSTFAPVPTVPPGIGSSNMPGWKVTASNVGLTAHGLTCASLPEYTGSEKPAAGAVISQKRITKALNLSEGGITIEKSCIRPTSVGQGLPIISTMDYNTFRIAPTTVTIRDSEIDGSLLGDKLSALSTGFLGIANLQRNYVHDAGSGIALMNTGKTLSSVIEGNYVTRLRAWGDPAKEGNHSDGFTIRDFSAAPGRQMIVRNNRFNCDSGNDTGAFFVQTYAGDIDNVTIEGNFLEGRGYQLALEWGFGNTYSKMKLINNRMSGTGYGAGYVKDEGPGWASQSENYLNDPTKPDNKGRPVSF